jgi:subtilisin family serine protease
MKRKNDTFNISYIILSFLLSLANIEAAVDWYTYTDGTDRIYEKTADYNQNYTCIIGSLNPPSYIIHNFFFDTTHVDWYLNGNFVVDNTYSGVGTYRPRISINLDRYGQNILQGIVSGAYSFIQTFVFNVDYSPATYAIPRSVPWTGAEELHCNNYLGTGIKIGMVEAIDAESDDSGLPWAAHGALTRLISGGDSDDSTASQHATGVASILIGYDEAPQFGSGDISSDRFVGMAPFADLYANTAGMTPWDNIDNCVLDLIEQGCEVINISAGYSPTIQGSIIEGDVNRTIDDHIDTDKVAIVVATGNDSTGLLDTAFPAEAYNVIAVGTLGDDKAAFPKEGEWTSTSSQNIPGPTEGIHWDYSTPRCKPDLVAPGRCFAAIPGLTGQSEHHYFVSGPGSSFAAPHVAGAVALLIDAARQNNAPFLDQNNKIDPKIIKSAMLTGANKSVLASGRTDPTWHVSNDTSSYPSLDYDLGAGGLNVLEAKKVLLSEDDLTTQRGIIHYSINWEEQLSLDLGNIEAGTILTASLVWHAHITLAGKDFADLDLYLLKDGEVFAVSQSYYDNVEHIYVPSGLSEGNYKLVIAYFEKGLDTEDFALSWHLATAPQPPVLVAPENATYKPGNAVGFTWDPVQNATIYRLVINTSSDFNSPLIDERLDGEQTTIIVTDFGDDDTVYYWQVFAGNKVGWSLPSQTRRFTNGEEPSCPGDPDINGDLRINYSDFTTIL